MESIYKRTETDNKKYIFRVAGKLSKTTGNGRNNQVILAQVVEWKIKQQNIYPQLLKIGETGSLNVHNGQKYFNNKLPQNVRNAIIN